MTSQERLITENFKITSGNNATKRKHEEAASFNFKTKMTPQSLDLQKSPLTPTYEKRRILGEIQNSQLRSSPAIERLKTPVNERNICQYNSHSPLAQISQNSLHITHNSPLTHITQNSSLKCNNISHISPITHVAQNSSVNPRHFSESPLARILQLSPISGRKHSSDSSLELISLRNISNSPLKHISPLTSRNISESPISHISQNSLLSTRTNKSPFILRNSLSSDRVKRTRITKVFEDRNNFKMSNKENVPTIMETFLKLEMEETRDCSFGGNFEASCRETKLANLSIAKLDFTDALQTFEHIEAKKSLTFTEEILVPEKQEHREIDMETSLHDLEEEFNAPISDESDKYEIFSTDSPNIISHGRSSTRKFSAKNFVFGAPIGDNEQSTSFNRPCSSARMLNFEDESFEFTSPAQKRCSNSAKKSLKFTESPPKSKLSLKQEKSDSSIGSMISPCSSKRYPSESTTSLESGFISGMEEPFLDIDEITDSPKINNFSELFSEPIKEDFIKKRQPLHRSLSFNPGASKAKVNLFSIIESPEKKTNKRNERSDIDSNETKRRKSNCENPELDRPRPVLQRAFSENNASIMSALARSMVDPDLIGDFSLPFALPLTVGHHSDLKSISCDTLAALLHGEFGDSINNFQVIDCRYPYEYEGGHILSAVNLYTPAQILTMVSNPEPPKEEETQKRSILVFHCEFSLERGPKLFRFLRSSDRAKNQENYPSLHYPEIYLLHEGYRKFYQQYPDLCSPAGYTAMLDPQHKHLLRRHRSVQQPSSASHKPTGHRKNRLLL